MLFFFRKIFFILFIALISTNALSYSIKRHTYLSAGIGINSTHLGSPTPIHYYNGMLTDDYPLSHSTERLNFFNLNAGYEFNFSDSLPLIAVGIGFYNTPSYVSYKGRLNETVTGDPIQTLFQYKFHLKNMRTMLETRLTWMIKQFKPYIDAGVGVSWINVNHYRETPVDNIGYVALPPFESSVTAHFAYQLGIGLGYLFNFSPQSTNMSHEQINLGYHFVSLGNSYFGTRGMNYPYHLKLGHLSANEFYLSYTHFI